MTSMRLARLGLLAVVSGCVHSGAHSYDALVDSYPNPQFTLDRGIAFCFVGGATVFPGDAALGKRQRHDELARICSGHARAKGVSMTASASAPNACVPCKLDWSVTGGAREPVEGRRLRSGRDDGFRKQIKLTAFHPNGGTVLEATASMWSDNDAFTDDTAEVLCRALFADFPARVNAKHYDVRLDH